MSLITRGLWLALILLPGAALAFDPSLHWYTIETPHFRVHFHEGPHMEALAQHTVRVCEAALARLVPRLHWVPLRKTEVTLSDDQDSANGSAYTLHRPWMQLYADVPDDLSVLNDYDDYLWSLVVHEYTHVLHLDTVTGPPSWVNAVIGKQLIPNAYAPRWYAEGLATYEETANSNAGRLRSSLFQMWLRASVLQSPFGLDDVSNSPQAWPRGNLAYLYGGNLMQHVADEVGDDALARYFDNYGGRLIPWTLNDTADSVWRKNFVQLYAGFMAQTKARFEAQLDERRAQGITPLRVLTHAGYSTDFPRFTHDGQRIIYMESGPDRRPQVRSMRVDGSDDRRIRELWTSGPMDVAPDDRHAVLALADVYEEYQVYDDLYELDLETGDLRRLSEGLRATEPHYSPDGTELVFVARGGGGTTWLGLIDRKTRSMVRLAEADPDHRIYTPTFTPDGAGIVYSQHLGTGRRLVYRDRASGAEVTWLVSEALIVDPEFQRDGTLFFASDASGIYNLYAFDPLSRALRLVSNVETGVFRPSPSPDGSKVALLTYSSRGYDIAVLRAEDAFAGSLPKRPPRPPPVYVDDPSVTLPVTDYDPVPSLLPLWWLPVVGADARGVTLGVVTGGSDVLGKHSYSVDLEWGLTSHEPSAFVSYRNRTFHPGLDVYGTTVISQSPGFPSGFYDRQWAGGASMTFPVSSFDRYVAASIGYEYRYYDPQFDPPSYGPDQPPAPIPRKGSTGTASLGFVFSNARGYADSISSEEGISLGATIRHSSPMTLGTFTITSAEARLQTYLKAPWWLHHVFALRLAAASALGDIGDRPVYSLGGIGIADPILQVAWGQRVGSGALRGYPARAFAGNSYALGTLEYRFPVAMIDRGIDTLPFYVRRLHGALFSDVGTTGPTAFTFGALHPSVGLEARLDLILGYTLGTELRAGVAQGFGDAGITNFYLTLGSSF